MKISLSRQLYWITLLYFALGFVNITLALSALICMILPFIMAGKTGKKIWCARYCPRADLLKRFSRISRKEKMPDWMKGNRLRNGILSYFCLNLLLIALSTNMVYLGQMPPMDHIRLFILFKIPFAMPQMIMFPGASDTLIHFSYRMYSIMLSSTILGSLFAVLYKPRTWCTVCPVSTMTDRMLQKMSIEKGS